MGLPSDVPGSPDAPDKEDGRAAVLIAIDAAKNLISIGVAFFAALSAFALNYRSSHTDFLTAAPILLMAFSAVVTLLSIILGLHAIGKAYKRGQKPPDADGPSWSTRPISGLLGAQSILGLGALLLFAASIVFWEAKPQDTADNRLERLGSALDALSKRADQQAIAITGANANLATLTQMISSDLLVQRLAAHDKDIDDLRARIGGLSDQLKGLSPPSPGTPARNSSCSSTPKPSHKLSNSRSSNICK